MPIPNVSYTPFVFINFDPVGGNRPSILNYTALLMGQKGSGGSATVDVRYLVQNADHAGKLFGYGSQLHRTFIAWFSVDKQTKAYGICRAASSFTERVIPYTFATSSLKAGTVCLYLGGDAYRLDVTPSDTATTIAAAMVLLVNKNPAAPFVASSSSGTFTLTAKGGYGILGAQLDVRFNATEGEQLPSGFTATAGSETDGAGGSADFTADIGDEWYNILVIPGAANLSTWDTFMEDRFSPEKQIDGRVFFSARGADYAALISAGQALNSKHLRYVHSHGVPNDPWQMAAQVAAYSSREGQIQPNRPLTNLELIGILAPAVADRMDSTESEQLLRAGISTFRIDPFGKVRIMRIISTYKTNEASAPDLAYLDDTTFATISYLRYDLRNRILSKYSRSILVDDDSPRPSGQPFVSPSDIRNEMVAIFRDWQAAGLVENADQFIESLAVTRNASDRTRIDIVMSPDLANPLMVLGVNVRYIL